jgi:ABC-type antimicrobial peptide transport system permease subunit
MTTSATIAIFISCIGLFGLTLFTTEKRAKEISIRKVLGATVTNIATMLSTEFIILVVIALVIASPIAWYLMSRWLQGFSYHVEINWWVFALAGFLLMTIAIITLGYQAVKAALTNPVKNLKSE